jgi:hypothetical protein
MTRRDLLGLYILVRKKTSFEWVLYTVDYNRAALNAVGIKISAGLRKKWKVSALTLESLLNIDEPL